MEQDFKARLRAGGSALCCLANMASPVAAEIVARAGFDAVMVDMEHGPGDVLNALAQFQAIAAGGAVPLARVPENAPVHLKRVLDAGPAGVMVPAVSNAEQAQAAVASCRYPPRGVRGVAHPIARASGYGCDAARYVAEGERRLLLICQIETLEGVGNADAVAATEGVDMIFVGPMDLSASAGHFDDPDHPEVDALMRRVEAAVLRRGKLLGGLSTAGRPAAALYERGYRFVIDATDVGLLRKGALASVAAWRSVSAGG